MSAIDWRQTQLKLKAAGYDPNGIDGSPGRGTFTALFAHQAQRQPDATLRAIGGVAAVMLPLYGWTADVRRLAEFLAETAHECGGYTRFAENMCYSAKRLMQVWPKRFPTEASALPFAWDPSDPDREDVALANYVYGSRMGNEANGTADDDGWDHRGSGMCMHTGAAEYAKLKQRLGLDPDDVRDPAKSVLAACDYMARAKTQTYIDRNDWSGSRQSINGGVIGIEDVAGRRARSMLVLT